MITKLGEARWSKVWDTLSEEAKQLLRSKGVVKSETTLANGLYNKFHLLNNLSFSHHDTSATPNIVRKHLQALKGKLNLVRSEGLDKMPGHFLASKDAISRVTPPRLFYDSDSFKKSHKSLMNAGGYVSKPGAMSVMDPTKIKNRLLSPFHKVISPAPTTALRHNAAALHELYENISMAKNPDTPNINVFKDIKSPIRAKFYRFMQNNFPDTPVIAQGLSGDTLLNTGVHNRLSVLGNEANDTRQMIRSNPISAKPLMDYRNSSTEAGILKRITGKNYGVDKFNKQDIHKLNSTPTNKAVFPLKGTGMSFVHTLGD